MVTEKNQRIKAYDEELSSHVHVRYRSSEVVLCLVLALRASLPFLVKPGRVKRTPTGRALRATCLEIAVWQGRGATCRVRTPRNNSKEVLGMAKW